MHVKFNFMGAYMVYINHAVDCGIPLARSDASLIFNSTLEGSQLIFWCDEFPNEITNASCLSDGKWSVDLNQYYNCSTRLQGIHLLITTVIVTACNANYYL